MKKEKKTSTVLQMSEVIVGGMTKGRRKEDRIRLLHFRDKMRKNKRVKKNYFKYSFIIFLFCNKKILKECKCDDCSIKVIFRITTNYAFFFFFTCLTFDCVVFKHSDKKNCGILMSESVRNASS